MGGPSLMTGATFTYDLTTGRSTPSTIAGVLDTWAPSH
jgi:hypothetical protein